MAVIDDKVSSHASISLFDKRESGSGWNCWPVKAVKTRSDGFSLPRCSERKASLIVCDSLMVAC
jgi:hypothetical protein